MADDDRTPADMPSTDVAAALDPGISALAAARRAAFEASARDYAAASRSPATWRAYESDWRRFAAFCAALEEPALPATPATVARFVAAEADAGRAVATLRRRLAAIRFVHRGAAELPPTDAAEVAAVLSGVARTRARPPQQAAAAIDAELRAMIDVTAGDAPAAVRDRALLLVGFAGALRRGELVALAVEDLERRPRGLLVHLRRSKTDQEGLGQRVALLARPGSRYCPVAALDDWLSLARIRSGPLFRRVYRSGRIGPNALSAATVAELVKGAARRAGLDAARYSGHSLRRGFLTSAAESKASLLKLLEQSRHRRVESVRGYIAEADRFDDHAGEALLRETAVQG